MTKINTGTMTQGVKLVLIMAAIMIVVLGMKASASIINSIALALILSISMTPILQWLIRKGLPGWLSLVVVTVAVVFAVVVLLVIIIVSLQNVAQALPNYQNRVQEITNEIADTLSRRGIDVSDVKDMETFSSKNLIDAGVTAASAVAGALSSWFFMLLLATYMLIEATDFPRKIEKSLKAGSAMPERFYKLNVSIRSYIFMTVWLGALNAVLITIMLFILGVDFALLWGVLAFLMSFIPYVGFIIALLPPTLMSLLEAGWSEALMVLAGFLILNLATDNILKPRVMGRGLELSPVVIMLSLFIWTWILGPVGALLAVPLTIIVKELLFESSEDTRWIANMMMPSESIPPPAADET